MRDFKRDSGQFCWNEHLKLITFDGLTSSGQTYNTHFDIIMISLKKCESITTNDIINVTSKLKYGSSPGIDRISSDLLKKYNIILCRLLSHFQLTSINEHLYIKKALSLLYIIFALHRKNIFNRKQLIKINNCISNEQLIKCGTPQFTLRIICYADDTVLICIGNTWNEVLIYIDNWLCNNNLFLNFNKSIIIPHFLFKHTLPPIKDIKSMKINVK
ncbi:hypothetical protein AGLY_008781 [Aphis glycines]|uniref:Reverse transcriptase domain-containing protein n=1 Tax=Aphis glycines TaxID=307491 RepID=A0A6G0TKF5_APHGL|nr:hypothetical protein AGLY_008781 [Aphis glycines]